MNQLHFNWYGCTDEQIRQLGRVKNENQISNQNERRIKIRPPSHMAEAECRWRSAADMYSGGAGVMSEIDGEYIGDQLKEKITWKKKRTRNQ